jgi:hypothetical protein
MRTLNVKDGCFQKEASMDNELGLASQLSEILITRFSGDDLRGLVFDLQLDYDNLRGDEKSGKARDLVAYLERRNDLAKLVRVGKKARPDISWPDIEPDPLHEGAITSPRKWVLVTGTGTDQSLIAKVSATAEQLGRSLAAYGFGLVTGGWPGVDEQIARSFNRELSKRHRPLENFLIQVVEENVTPAFPGGDLRIVKAGGFGDRLLNLFDAWISKALEEADIVIVVEGAGGAGKIAKAALGNRKVVLPLADTDGDAKKLYWEMYMYWDKTQPLMSNVSKKQFAIAAREAPAVVQDIIVLLDSLFPIGGSQGPG